MNRTLGTIAAAALALAASPAFAQERMGADVACKRIGQTMEYDCLLMLKGKLSGHPIQGAGVVVGADMPSMPRGLILPPDASEEAQEWWIETMQEVVETDAWQEYLDENFLLEDERWGEDFTSYLDETQTSFEEQLTELGAL